MSAPNSVYLWLGGPIQSWAAGRMTGNRVDTVPIPTRSGLEGLIGAAHGWAYGHKEPWIKDVAMRVRVDNPGVLGEDFQTINPMPEHIQEIRGRYHQARTGKRASKTMLAHTPDGQSKTAIVRRTYLQGAAFIVEAGGVPDVEHFAYAMAHPMFPLVLGKQAFNAGRVLIGAGEAGQLATLPRLEAGSNDSWWDEVEGEVTLPIYDVDVDVPFPTPHPVEVVTVPTVSERFPRARALTKHLTIGGWK